MRKYGLRPELVRTVSKVKMWCRFAEFGHLPLLLSLSREDESAELTDERTTKDIPFASINECLNFTGGGIREYIKMDNTRKERERDVLRSKDRHTGLLLLFPDGRTAHQGRNGS